MVRPRSGRALKRAQIVCSLVCVLGLADIITGESSTTVSENLSGTSPPHTSSPIMTTNTPEGGGVHFNDTTTSDDITKDAANTTQITTESVPTTNHSWLPSPTSTSPSLDLQNETTSNILPNSTAGVTSNVTHLTSDHSVQSTLTLLSYPTLSGPENKTVPVHVRCQSIRTFRESTNVIHLELNESTTCESFKEVKGEKLVRILCELPNSTFLKSDQCHLQLSTSEVNPKYLLLILHDKDDAKKTFDVMQTQRSSFHQMGIQQYKLEKVYDHLDRTRKTLIALLTCGLLLAAIVIAGLFLSNRQSWSPGRQRLGEDPYYTENDSQDNTVLSVASNDQSQLQEKPNLNGGTQENGTGQTVTAAASNGHSTRQHVVADTEL
ncbi:hematopoietic progenitor cell antigen CD34 [Microcaecilia unicolor]|uniref:Hematopoietic progenitor cell antigen CD34 n=1 Tax=Microcaecilia unicolor TaxID=1415580 RepID=A0A6P7ZQH5_9AMPH|nr:hematopoietic progenitor cell antigen CD34 [Microcaecilia unicolor]